MSQVQMNSGEQSEQVDSSSICSSPATMSNSLSPFIKRKCLDFKSGQKCVRRASFMVSPYSAKTDLVFANSPKLNESFEILQISASKTSNRRRRVNLVKHKSATFSNYEEKNSSPLNDISNQINQKSAMNHSGQLNGWCKLNDEIVTSQEESKDDLAELENLIFGANSNENSQSVKQMVETRATCNNLIGDCSKKHILPVVASNKHHDLQCISPQTLVELLDGKFDHQIDEYLIIDSRYPYEFDGGHIMKAANIYTKEKLVEEMFFKRLHLKNINKLIDNEFLMDLDMATIRRRVDISKRFLVIFHCEFSSERGPSLLRFLRNQDRNLNANYYPFLFYPELYLLSGGYKQFFEKFQNYCNPQTYKPMLHIEHLNDLKHFRAKAKSWGEPSRTGLIQKLNEQIEKEKSSESLHNSPCKFSDFLIAKN